MSQANHRLFQIREGEAGPVILLGVLLFINSMALELADVVAVSGFISQVSQLSQILIVWAIDMALVAISASAQSLIVDRFNRTRVLQLLVVIFIITYSLLRLMFILNVPSVINYALLFLLLEQQWIFFPLVFWVLANDTFDLAQAKRLFPLITAFSFVGQIVGLGLASAAPRILDGLGLDRAEPLTFNVIIYVIALVLTVVGLRRIRIRERAAAAPVQTVQETLSEGFGFVKEVPAFRYLMLALLATAMVVTISDYHFLRVSDTAFQVAPPGSFQTFYGLYRLIVTVIAIAVQTLATGRLMDRLQLKSIFLLLPASMLASLGLMLIPGLPTVVAGRALFRVAQSSIDDPARKTLLSLVPDERRGRVSVFMESYLFAAGVIVACGIVGALVVFGPRLLPFDPGWVYLGIGVAAALAALWSALKMRQTYDKSMLNWRLRRRSRGANVLDGLEF